VRQASIRSGDNKQFGGARCEASGTIDRGDRPDPGRAGYDPTVVLDELNAKLIKSNAAY
jgi:hypothetical protein